MKPVLAFDMDGVLVEVSESYRETIQRTVEHFTGSRITRDFIQEIKNRGGWNDDWKLCDHLIREAGVRATYETVVDHFQGIFHGKDGDGLILRERWIAADGLFERLSERYQLAVFTGRLKWEANVTLARCAPHLRFDPLIGNDDVERGKPAPDGLHKIRTVTGSQEIWYVGDTVDDARSARAAGVPFIGIAAPSSARRDELVDLFRAEQAIAVLDDINQLERVLER
jgi:HAD superfamily phosphatase